MFLFEPTLVTYVILSYSMVNDVKVLEYDTMMTSWTGVPSKVNFADYESVHCDTDFTVICK